MKKSTTRRVLQPCSAFVAAAADEQTNCNFNDEINGSASSTDCGTAVNGVQNVQNLIDLGSSCAEQGQYAAAMNYWYRALVIDVNNAIIHELKAQVFLELDEPLKACLSAETAVKLAPDWYAGYHTLARAQREAGELDLSVKNYELANEMFPGDAVLASELNEVRGLLNELQFRRHVYESELHAAEDNKEAQTCLYNMSARAGCMCRVRGQASVVSDARDDAVEIMEVDAYNN